MTDDDRRTVAVGHLTPPAFGENLTISGVLENDAVLG